jgi:hypothetical protein
MRQRLGAPSEENWMPDQSKPATRRKILFGAALLSSVPLLAQVQTAEAAGTTPQSAVKYQGAPNGANHCGKCKYFIPGANATAVGQCKVVAGQISPNGWCILFAAKPA